MEGIICPLVGIGLTDLPKSWRGDGGDAPPFPMVLYCSRLKKVHTLSQESFVFYMAFCIYIKNSIRFLFELL